jgi:TRAP-type C4-dicarboxylate transport system substrate-binding protein
MAKILTKMAVLFMLAAPVYSAQVIKLATITPENSQWMRDMRAGAAEIEQRTDGRVKIKLYGGGVMGNDKKVLRKIRIGQLHGGAFTANSLQERYPDLNIYGLPMLFESQEEVDYVRARIDERLAAGLEEAGWVSFGFAGGGFARMMSNTPVRTLDDLADQKVWVPEGDQISYAGMEALDLAPVTLPVTDVLTGLQTGLLDIVTTPPVGAVVLQWYTKVKYVTDLPLVYTMAYVAIDKKTFDRLSAEDQAVVRDVMSGIYARFDEVNRTDNVDALAALENAGIEIVEPDAEQVPQWREAVAAANRDLARQGVFSAALLEEVEGLLNEYRQLVAADEKQDKQTVSGL